MGNLDKWSTPKQIKIERAGEPKGTKRGILKKGERRKGKKARIDELLSAKTYALRLKEWALASDKESEESSLVPHLIKAGFTRYNPRFKQRFEEQMLKLTRLVAKAVNDGVITVEESKDYIITLYPPQK